MSENKVGMSDGREQTVHTARFRPLLIARRKTPVCEQHSRKFSIWNGLVLTRAAGSDGRARSQPRLSAPSYRVIQWFTKPPVIEQSRANKRASWANGDTCRMEEPC
jgi:hypothetical protein